MYRKRSFRFFGGCHMNVLTGIIGGLKAALLGTAVIAMRGARISRRQFPYSFFRDPQSNAARFPAAEELLIFLNSILPVASPLAGHDRQLFAVRNICRKGAECRRNERRRAGKSVHPDALASAGQDAAGFDGVGRSSTDRLRKACATDESKAASSLYHHAPGDAYERFASS